MRAPVIIDDPTFNDRVNRLIATQGDPIRAGMTLEEVADLVFTRRMRINPLVDSLTNPTPKAPRKPKLTGPSVEDLIG